MTPKFSFLVAIVTVCISTFASVAVFAVGLDGDHSHAPDSVTIPQSTHFSKPQSTAIPTPAQTNPSTQSLGISVGTRVYVSNTFAQVRPVQCSEDPIATVQYQTEGEIIGDAVMCGGLLRWQIRWDNGVTGWTAENDGTTALIEQIEHPFAENDQIVSTADNLSVRSTACGSTLLDKVPLNAKGVILSKISTTVPNCQFGSEHSHWWNIEWYDSSLRVIASGWSSEQYLQLDTQSQPPITDTNPPFVSIQNATDASIYVLHSTPAIVEVLATDAETSVAYVELFIDGVKAMQDSVSHDGWSFTLSDLEIGTHSLRADATDQQDNTKSSPVITLHIVDIEAPEYQTTISGDVNGQKYDLTIDYFENVNVARIYGTFDVLNSCTQAVLPNVSQQSEMYVVSVQTEMQMGEDQMCAMGTTKLFVDGTIPLSLTSTEISSFNSLFAIDSASMIGS